jgi:hypothetical protein
MQAAPFNWPLFLGKLARDELYEKLGYYGRSRRPYPTKYVCPPGVAFSCDAYGGAPYVLSGRQDLIDLSTYRSIADGAVIWMRIEALPLFNREILPHLKSRFVLVTGESDWSTPSNFTWAARTLVESGKLIRWFASNYDGAAHGDIITPMPYGIEYPKRTDATFNRRAGSYCAIAMSPAEHEAEWDAFAAAVPPLAARDFRAIADFQFNNTSKSRIFGETREEVYAQLADNPNIAWAPKRRMDPMEPRKRFARHVFMIYTYGRGLDGHRVWESLQLGCIPIVKKGPLDLLYRDLPVVSIDQWDEITEDNMQRWYRQFGPGFDRAPVHRILSMQYWNDRIRAAAAAG